MKRLFLIVLLFIATTGLVSCGKQNEMVEKNARMLADAFADGDMATINKTIFGTNGFEVDEELSDIWGETSKSQEGVLEHIFEHVTVKVKKTTESTIEYEINAPDMKNVFVDFNANTADISEDELLQHIKDYAKNAETTATTVSLEYIIVDDEFIVDYQDEAFINAVTGGLLDAYKSLYEEMMEEYMEGVK